MDIEAAVLKLVEQVGGLAEGVKDLKEDFGRHCSRVGSVLTLIQNGEMAICKVSAARQDRLQNQITVLRNGKKSDADDGTDIMLGRNRGLKNVPVQVLVAVVAVVVLGGVAGVIGWAALSRPTRSDMYKATADKARIERLTKELAPLVLKMLDDQKAATNGK